MRLITISLLILLFISCDDKKKSRELTNKAVEIYLDHQLKEEEKTEQSLALINSALSKDPENISALNHKRTLLFYKKDIDGLLELSDKFLEISPGSPFYLGQKALYLEIKGDIKLAKKYYEISILTYKQRLLKDSLNFDLHLEYMGILGLVSDSIAIDNLKKKLRNQKLEDYQYEMLDHMEEKQIFYPKEFMLNYFKGDINYDDIEHRMNN